VLTRLPILITSKQKGSGRQSMWAERKNGAERAENRLKRSGAVSGVQKIKWSV